MLSMLALYAQVQKPFKEVQQYYASSLYTWK